MEEGKANRLCDKHTARLSASIYTGPAGEGVKGRDQTHTDARVCTHTLT